MVFGVELEENDISFSFFMKSKKNLESKVFFKSPFDSNSFIKRIESGFYVVQMNPSYPPVYYFGFALLFGALVFTNFKLTGWLLPGFFLSLTGIFWSDSFQFLFLKLGLSKMKYKGYIKRLSKQKVIRRLI